MGHMIGLFGSALFGILVVSMICSQPVHPGIVLGAVFILWVAGLRISYLETIIETVHKEIHRERVD